MISEFQFKSYKIDRFRYQMTPYLQLLEINETFDQNLWELEIGVRQPLFSKGQKAYIGGLDIRLSLELPDDQDKEKKIEILQLEAGIAGLFVVKEGKFEKETEEKLVKYQIPALLLPYLRGTITSFLSNAGFASVILPLINIHALAEKQLKDIDIEVIE